MTRKDKLTVLKEEISRLGTLLKEEQSEHRKSREKAESDLVDLRNNLEEAHNSKILEIISEFEKQNLDQKDSYNRRESVQSCEYTRKVKQLDDELKDNQVAFEHFQAQSRKQFNIEFERRVKEIEDREHKKRLEFEGAFQSRLRQKLRDQRIEIVSEQKNILEKLEEKQKQEVSVLTQKIGGNIAMQAKLRDTEAQTGNLLDQIHSLSKKNEEVQKQLNDKDLELKRFKRRIQEWEDNYAKKISDLVNHHNLETERLLQQVTELRSRLVHKAEMIGQLQYKHNNLPVDNVMGPMNESNHLVIMENNYITVPRPSKKVTRTAGTGELSDILTINQFDR